MPLQSKKQICLLSIMVKIVSLLGQSSGRLAYCVLYRFRFPKLGVSQLPCRPTVQHPRGPLCLISTELGGGVPRRTAVNMLRLMLLAVL